MLRLLTTRLPVAFEHAPPPGLLTYEAPTDGADEYAHLAELVRPCVDAGDLVLTILDERSAEPLHERLLAVRSALETTRLVVHRTTLPPLAAAGLARMLVELDAEGVLPPSVLASGAGRLEREVLAGAWLGSVAKLRHPSPPLRLHARSWLPSSGFGAVLGDDPRVVRHKGPDAVLPLPELDPAHEWRVLVGTGLGDLARVQHTLATRAAGAEVLHVPARRATSQWWGTDRVVELAVLPRSSSTMRRAVLGRTTTASPTVDCPWCGEVVAAAVCPLCGADTVPAVTRSGGPS